MNFLIPRNKNSFIIKSITIPQTLEIITKLPNSNSTGHDDLNNKFLKKIKNKIAPHLTHMVNMIIKQKIYPDIFKLARILPLSKSNTDTQDTTNLDC